MSSQQRRDHGAAMAILAALALLCVATGTALAAEQNTGLQGRDWVLKALGSTFRAPQGELTVRLENGKLGGDGGINTFFGAYKLEESKLSVSAMGSTKMAGDAAMMVQESAYFGLLEKAVGFGASAYRLVLTAADGQFLLLFEPRGVDQANRPVIHAPSSGEPVGPNVTVAGRTGSGRQGMVNIVTDVYADGRLWSSVPGHRSRTTSAGKYWMRVATPRPKDDTTPDLLYVVRVVELDSQDRARGPEAWVALPARK
jgi:heat shock protein HslJ